MVHGKDEGQRKDEGFGRGAMGYQQQYEIPYRAGTLSIFFFLSCTNMCYVVMVIANGVSFNAGPLSWGAKSGYGGGR